MSGMRQGSTLALPLENQPRTEEREGTFVTGAAEMVTRQFGLIPLGRGPSGAGASEQQQAQWLKRKGGTGASPTPEDTVPAWAALGACALALVLPTSQFLTNTPSSEHPAPGLASASHSPRWLDMSPHPARPPQCHR